VATEVVGDIGQSVCGADIVILATPICTFENCFGKIAGFLRRGCIVTDVGSTKVLPHRWAAKKLPKSVHYVGSHPIAGSEQRGVEYSRDDLLEDAICVLTRTAKTNRSAVRTLKDFWSELGCVVKTMKPREHDRVFANVSHLPHVTAAALINASKADEMKMAGRGFLDTSRIASGPVNIWADILMTNSANVRKGIDRLVGELGRLRRALDDGDKARLEKLLKSARDNRGELMKYKMKKKEVVP
jgi:prephenate dehydrogenase